MPRAGRGPGGRRAIRAGSASSISNHAKMRPRHRAGAFAGQLTIGSAASNASNWMSSAAAHRVPVRAKRIGARPRLDQLELRKPCPYLVGRNALRKKPGTPLSGLPPERVQQVGCAGPRRPGDLARVCRLCRLRQGVEASLIKEKVEARNERIIREPRYVDPQGHDPQVGGPLLLVTEAGGGGGG